MISDEAIILAGGLGTRLRPVLSDLPKPMAPINDKPFLEYMLSYLSSYGIRHVVLSVGYKHELIKSHFGSSFSGIKLTYAIEEEPLGTGGAIRYALNFIQSQKVFLLNGDTFFNVNLRDLSEFYKAYNPDIAMTIRLMHDFFRYGTVQHDISRVTGFVAKKPVKRGFINGGIYLIRKALFDNYDLPDKFSFESDFLEKNLDQLEVYAMECSDYFIDIGIPKDYEKARTELPGLIQ